MDATLEAVKREGRGKNEANRLRASGKIPGVVYGTASKGKAPEGVAVSVDPKALLQKIQVKAPTPAKSSGNDPWAKTGLTKSVGPAVCEQCHNDKSPKFRGFWFDAMKTLVHKSQ